MLAILNSLNAHNFPIFQPILMILVSKFMVHRALSDKTYLSLGLLSPLTSLHSSVVKVGPPLTNLSRSAHGYQLKVCMQQIFLYNFPEALVSH